MGSPTPTDLKKTGFVYSSALTEVIHQLEEIVVEMVSDGFETEADTLKTTIGDLQWQYEEVIDKELTGQWPNGPRRAVRSPVGRRSRP